MRIRFLHNLSRWSQPRCPACGRFVVGNYCCLCESPIFEFTLPVRVVRVPDNMVHGVMYAREGEDGDPCIAEAEAD